MIVFASTLRTVRRPRRIPSVASVVRALGTVRVSDQPATRPVRPTPPASRSPRHPGPRLYGPNGAPRTSC